MSSFVGFFTRQGLRGPCFVPVPRSALGPGNRALSSFVTPPRAILFDWAVPLVYRRSLLVVRLGVNGASGYMDETVLRLAVCNLLAGTCNILPPIKLNSPFINYVSNGVAILTGGDYCSEDELWPSSNSSCLFKVVIIGSGQDDRYRFYVFASDKTKLERAYQLLQ